ncbi:TPA: hypothetical protein RG395_002814 [Legionella pneumophila]|uniref:hypothetical protein n=1 Tax=Legionella pneumophila TaxID=446 RepID=UPI000B0D920F|nr:hypothetical protein [Legionella pneumophila]MDW8880297.1 hypothetical protein [Legionella pneumophila subsp. fraseri]MDW9036911.1 hypothetical protein [Legionella pneumophila subsp. fraseri]MDW9040156.1 hypothetical protein [Legionella pneumophila subsp. fraseri]MDW9043105.1 hypothetical protein [Legionella pneumophila subsp. fraseri]MDW9064773.1 hypothetical protein [Legionella pneumophila subsp. fraseri]
MYNKKSYSLLLIVLFFLLNLSAFAATRVVSTPYYKIELERSMQLLQNYNSGRDNIPLVSYTYGSIYKNIETSLTIQVVPIPATNREKAQRQFIAGMVNGLQRRHNSETMDKFMVFNKTREVHLNNKKFKNYTYSIRNGIIEIFTTINKDKLYCFVIASYGKNTQFINEINQSLIDKIAKIEMPN